MKTIFGRALLALCISLAAILALGTALTSAALQNQALVARASDINPADIAQAIALARAHDPRRLPVGQLSTLLLSEHDADVLLNQASNRWLGAAVRVGMQGGRAHLHASVQVPANPLGRWLNVQLGLQETAGLPVVTDLRLGDLPLPAWLGSRLGMLLVERAGLLAELDLASGLIKQVSFAPQRLMLTYALDRDSTRRMVAALLPAGEAERLRAYSDLLVNLAGTEAPAAEPSLARWLGPMFALARQRSLGGSDAAAENRCAIVALALYVNGRGADSLLPAARSWPKPQPLRLTLSGRQDFPMHLLISAAVAVESTGALSKAIGVWKEVDDSRRGSGFSFNDIAADRAGTRLGELALTQPHRLQDILASGVQESDVMPAWTDLPEFLPEAEFKRRYGGVGAAPYLALLAEIDRRVSALPALR
jgi:hypothetical protein